MQSRRLFDGAQIELGLLPIVAAGGGVDALTATGIAAGTPTVGSPAIGQVHALIAIGVLAGTPTLGSPALGQTHVLTATGVAAGTPSLGSPALGQIHTLAAIGISVGTPDLGAPILGVLDLGTIVIARATIRRAVNIASNIIASPYDTVLILDALDHVGVLRERSRILTTAALSRAARVSVNIEGGFTP